MCHRREGPSLGAISIAGLVDEALGDLQTKTVTLHGDAEALGSADVDVVDRQIHAVAGFLCPQGLDGREDRLHAGLELDALVQRGSDQEGLDAFLNDLRHRPGNHEGRILDIQGVLQGHVFGRCE